MMPISISRKQLMVIARSLNQAAIDNIENNEKIVILVK